VPQSGNFFIFRRILLRKGLYLLLLFTLLTGCTVFVKAPVVTVRDLNVVSLDGGGAGMELYLTVKNTNPYDLRLLGYSYDLKVMGLPLAKGVAREEVKFPAGVATDLLIPIRVPYGDLLEIFTRKPNFDSVPYQLSAGLDLDTPLGKLTVPVNRAGTYAVPKQYRPSALLNKLSDFFRMNK
jgi:LEA14-like dessication related protein